MRKTRRGLLQSFLVTVILLAVSVSAFAAETNLKPQKSNMNFTMEEADGKCLINYNDTWINPENIDALLVVNGKLMTAGHVQIKDGSSLIPLRAVSNALGMDIQTNEEYVTAKFIEDNMNCTVQFQNNIIVFSKKMLQKYDNLQNRASMPIVSIEQNYDPSMIPITQEQAVDVVKANVTSQLRQHYKGKKSIHDVELFIEQISYKSVSQSMGRFYRIEVHFYDQWSKRFESYAFVDRYSQQLYMGDQQYGLTDNILPYLTKRYENHLPIENNPTKLIAFSEMDILTDSPFLVVNFPEQIHDNAFLETYYYRTDSIQGSGRVFFSHKNCTEQPMDYIVRFQNVSDQEATLSIVEDKAIHTVEEYQDQMIKAHMERFYKQKLAGRSNDMVLSPGEIYDTVLPNILNEQFFTGIVDFDAADTVSVTVFAVQSTTAGGEGDYSGIPSPKTLYDYDYIPKAYTVSQVNAPELKEQYYSTYSGRGAGYRIAAGGELRASDMIRSQNFAFETGGSLDNINHRNGLTEIVDIELQDARGENGAITKATWLGNIWKEGEPEAPGGRENKDILGNYGNLGNWGVEYNVTVRLTNDTDTDKQFSCEIVPAHQITWAFIVNEYAAAANLNNKKYADTFKRVIGSEYDQIHIGSGIVSGNMGSVVVKAHETKEFTYTYILGTECSSTVYHIWTCIDPDKY